MRDAQRVFSIQIQPVLVDAGAMVTPTPPGHKRFDYRVSLGGVYIDLDAKGSGGTYPVHITDLGMRLVGVPPDCVLMRRIRPNLDYYQDLWLLLQYYAPTKPTYWLLVPARIVGDLAWERFSKPPVKSDWGLSFKKFSGDPRFLKLDSPEDVACAILKILQNKRSGKC
jgi:hypothetical protein